MFNPEVEVHREAVLKGHLQVAVPATQDPVALLPTTDLLVQDLVQDREAAVVLLARLLHPGLQEVQVVPEAPGGHLIHLQNLQEVLQRADQAQVQVQVLRNQAEVLNHPALLQVEVEGN